MAFTPEGWNEDVLVSIDLDGKISDVKPQHPPKGLITSILLPSPTNLHSHSFQRAMAGLTETKDPDRKENFWSWRELMYKFLAFLDPDDFQTITELAMMEMLEAGFASMVEFHYLHNARNGAKYDDVGELSKRVIAAAESTGMGLTLVPIAYNQGGCDGRPLAGGQVRFQNSPDQYQAILAAAQKAVQRSDTAVGSGAHSLRAVSTEYLTELLSSSATWPFHIHVAEQMAEVDEVRHYLKQRPVEYLLDNFPLNRNWCLIHCTQMTPEETARLANSGAVAGLCPITESNLGDGIFDGVRYAESNGRYGIGTDSNIRINLTGEYRTLEYSQRLRDRARVRMTSSGSVGLQLLLTSCEGGRFASGRNNGAIKQGCWADFIELDGSSYKLCDLRDDRIADTWIFNGGDQLLKSVWSAGQIVVVDGQHRRRTEIISRYSKMLRKLKTLL